KSSDAGGGTDGLTVLHDWVGHAEWYTSVVFLQVFQADFQMQLTGASNDVLAEWRYVSQDARIGFRETLKTFDQLGKILGVLDFDGTLDNGRDGELHDLQVVCGLVGGQGTGLEQELIDSDQTKNVTSRHIFNGFNEATHHKNGTLNSLDEEV